MFGHSHKSTAERKVVLWVAEPTRSDFKAVRRWCTAKDTGVSNEQFNVYRLAQGYLVTMQKPDGSEVEDNGVFHGGRCQSVTDAYNRMSAYLTIIQVMTGLAGWSRMTVIFDATPGIDPRQCGSLEFCAVQKTAANPLGGAAREVRCFDPDTGAPLSD